MRHVSRTHRVALDWLFDRINLDPKIQINQNSIVNTADLTLKQESTASQWNSSGIFPRIQYVAAQRPSQKFTVQVRRDTREFHRKNHIYVDVQRHFLWNKRQWKRMPGECQTRFSVCKKIWKRCKHYTSKYRKWLRKSYMKTMATVKSYENKCVTNCSNTSKIGTTRTTTTNSSPSTTPMTTLTQCTCTSTDAWRTCTESARIFVPQHCDDTRTPHGSSPERFHTPSMVIHMAHSPWLASPLSTSSFSSCLSPSSSSTSSCSLSSTTLRTWQTCAAPLQKRVRTPWTSSSLPLKDNGHSLIQVLKRSGTLSVKIVHKENGIIWLKGGCWNSQKADVRFSVLQPHCPEVNSKAKDIGKLSIHYAADLETVETMFRTIVCANQLSLLRSSRRNVWRIRNSSR